MSRKLTLLQTICRQHCNFASPNYRNNTARGRCLNEERRTRRILSLPMSCGVWGQNVNNRERDAKIFIQNTPLSPPLREAYITTCWIHTQLDSKARFHYSNQRRRRSRADARSAFFRFSPSPEHQKLVIGERAEIEIKCAIIARREEHTICVCWWHFLFKKEASLSNRNCKVWLWILCLRLGEAGDQIF
jgi:hypothetical protein